MIRTTTQTTTVATGNAFVLILIVRVRGAHAVPKRPVAPMTAEEARDRALAVTA